MDLEDLHIMVLKQALRFYGSFDVTVTGITIQNSPQCHLKFDNCVGVSVYNFSVSSPSDSPNTDGIHLQNSKDVLIHTTDLSCGNYSHLDKFFIVSTRVSHQLQDTIFLTFVYVGTSILLLRAILENWFLKS